MSRAESVAVAVTPLVVVATFALGLRLGAQKAVRAAVVYGAPPSSGRAGLAWQVVTVLDSGGVREAVSVPGLTVTAHSGGQEARWQGATNADGVAEAWLPLAGVKRGDLVSLEVRAAGETTPLAEGTARWEARSWGPPDGASPYARPSKRQGELEVDLAIPGQRLAPTFAESLWVRVIDRTNGQPVGGAVVAAEPDPGLDVPSPRVTACDNGWAELTATAEMHVVGLSLRVESAGGRRGTWYGALPVAPGASFVALPAQAAPNTPLAVDVRVPTVRSLVYVEVDDRAGRAFAAALHVTADADGTGHAPVEIPALTEGQYWVVTSGDPRGAESLEAGSVAWPLRVKASATPPRCDAGPARASAIAAPFARWVALDGLPGKRARDGSNHARGLFLALASLATGAVLESLLLLRAAARTKADLARLDAELEGAGAPHTTVSAKRSTGALVVALLLALLGFAALAALLSLRTS